jgi:molecular chaperone HscB
MNCWHCENPVDELFCGFCHTLQAPPADYYTIFGMPRTLGLDVNQLQERFYKLSRVLHPDHYSRKSETERECSSQATARLNDAWRTLRDPVTRAEYVLSQEGFEAAEQRANDVPPELLEEVFELNMALEELRMGDATARPALDEARAKFIKIRDEIDRGLASLFAKYDLTHDRKVLGDIRGSLNRRRYIRNLVQEVEKELV